MKEETEPGETETEEDRTAFRILKEFRKIAVVGMSADVTKPANRVPKYLIQQGYKITPVNPTKDEIEGLKSYPSVLDIPDEVEVVEVFRRSEQVPEIMREIIERKTKRGDVKAVWLQEGVVSDEAKKMAEENGILFVQNRCMFRDHLRYRDKLKVED